MQKKKYQWEVGKTPPRVDPHSLVKHKIVREYLRTYVAVLTARPQLERLRLTLVDGFAGGGMYSGPKKELRPGSPLIMLESMAAAEVLAKVGRKKDFKLDVEYFFVDEDESACHHLTTILKASEYRSQPYQVLTGPFQQFAPQLIAHIAQRVKQMRGGRSIFLLDQYGYSDVPFPLIRKIFQALPKAEVILTISTDALIDYLGNNAESRIRLENVGLDLSLRELERAKAEQPSVWRKAIQFNLHNELFVQSGAKHYTPFFIRSPDSHRAYWLVHLSNHHRARDVMVALHWASSNDFLHYGHPGLQMLGYDPMRDVGVTGQRLIDEFAFDHSAQSRTHDALMVDVPRRLAGSGDGLSFDEFFAKTTNETPATSDLMRSVVQDLARDGELVVYDTSGARRRTGSAIKNGDRIVRSRQTLLLPREAV
jgi:three-Cys-motif partner protein